MGFPFASGYSWGPSIWSDCSGEGGKVDGRKRSIYNIKNPGSFQKPGFLQKTFLNLSVDVRPDQLTNFLIRLIIQNNLGSERTVTFNIVVGLYNDIQRKKVYCACSTVFRVFSPFFVVFSLKTLVFVVISLKSCF